MNRTVTVVEQVKTNTIKNEDNDEYSPLGKVISFIKTKREIAKRNKLKEEVSNKISSLNLIKNNYISIDNINFNSKSLELEDNYLPYPTNDINKEAEFIRLSELFTKAVNNVPEYSKHKRILLDFIKKQSFKEMFQYMNDYILYDEVNLSNELLDKFYNKPVVNYLESIGVDIKNDIEYERGECVVAKKYLDMNLYKLNNNLFMSINSHQSKDLLISETMSIQFNKLLRLVLIKEHYTKVLIAYTEKLLEEFPNLTDL